MVKLPKEIRDRLESVAAKRPRTVVRHILKHGSISSQELLEVYGYEHPPRAIRDVRELGIPIVTAKTKDKTGKSIAEYRFGDLSKWRGVSAKASGRTALAKALKKALIEKFGSRCFIYLETMDAASLQLDHRVPYEIGGESSPEDAGNFMLLCPSANRAKSWTCEHCANWVRKDPSFCVRCFWAHPENYDHVAGKFQKVVTVVFTGDEVEDYNRLVSISGEADAQTTIKRILHEKFNDVAGRGRKDVKSRQQTQTKQGEKHETAESC